MLEFHLSFLATCAPQIHARIDIYITYTYIDIRKAFIHINITYIQDFLSSLKHVANISTSVLTYDVIEPLPLHIKDVCLAFTHIHSCLHDIECLHLQVQTTS